MIKTRFAPSPTGSLHVGGVRTALFSFLFAKVQGGQFVLRIEDTDEERSHADHAHTIIEAMAWLGLTPDEGPIYQSHRRARYAEVIDQLLASQQAYRCVCTKERLEALREQQIQDKQKPRYDGRCRDLALQVPDQPYVIRLKSPQTGTVSFNDLVFGPLQVENTELDDLVLVRGDGVPTYNFAVVVDDADMNITHVIRGDDHINNTPRQLHIYQALQWTPPQFAHLPMILGSDGKRLSKRHGAVNVLAFQEAGYLPEALLNYLVRLGWSHGDQEIFSLADMCREFDLSHVSRSPASFNYEKLIWLNQHYLKTMPVEALVGPLREQLTALGIVNETSCALAPVIQALATRSKTLKEMAEKSRCYLMQQAQTDPGMEVPVLSVKVQEAMQTFRNTLSALETWTKETIHQAIAATCEAHGLKMGEVAQPLRIWMTGSTQSPPIDETVMLVGKAWALERLDKHLLAI